MCGSVSKLCSILLLSSTVSNLLLHLLVLFLISLKIYFYMFYMFLFQIFKVIFMVFCYLLILLIHSFISLNLLKLFQNCLNWTLVIRQFILQMHLHTYQNGIGTQLFILALFMRIAKDWKHSMFIKDWWNKLLYIHMKGIQCRKMKERERENALDVLM